MSGGVQCADEHGGPAHLCALSDLSRRLLLWVQRSMGRQPHLPPAPAYDVSLCLWWKQVSPTSTKKQAPTEGDCALQWGSGLHGVLWTKEQGAALILVSNHSRQLFLGEKGLVNPLSLYKWCIIDVLAYYFPASGWPEMSFYCGFKWYSM